jgi:bile acid:Na+ symporter, BASS family
MNALLPIGLAFIMFSLGISLQTSDFFRIVTQPRAVLIGLFAQVICLPLIAFAILKLTGITGTMAIGMMIIAACPGGVSAGLLTLLAGGQTALSVSLTAMTSLSVLFTLPLTLSIVISHFSDTAATVSMPVMQTGGGVFLMTVLPVLLGMLLRHKRTEWVIARLENPLAKISTVVFLLIVVKTFVDQRVVILDNLTTIGPAILLFNVLAMLLGFVAARVSGLPKPSRIAISMECGLHNAALGIFVANVLLTTPALAGPSVVYAFLMNFTAFAVVFYYQRQNLIKQSVTKAI